VALILILLFKHQKTRKLRKQQNKRYQHYNDEPME
jgi:hypothetical protein